MLGSSPKRRRVLSTLPSRGGLIGRMRSFINPLTAKSLSVLHFQEGEGPRCHSGAWVLHVVCLKKAEKQALYPWRLLESQTGLHKRSDLFSCSNTGIEMAVLFADRKTLSNVTYYKQNAFCKHPSTLIKYISLCFERAWEVVW